MEKVAIVVCENYEKKTVYRGIIELMALLGGYNNIFKEKKDILIKPNLCLPADPDLALTTHPEVVNAMVKVCRLNRCDLRISIGDSPVGRANTERNALIWEKTQMQNVALQNACKVDYLNKSYITKKREAGEYLINSIVDEDINIINISKFKTHGLMLLSGAIKNLFGLIPDEEKKRLHRQFPTREAFAELLVDICGLVAPTLNIVDAVVALEGEGPGVRGIPKKIGVLLASTSAIGIDVTLAKIMNIDPMSVPTNQAWRRRYGELPVIKVVGENIDDHMSLNFKLPELHRYDNAALVKKLFGLKYSKPSINLNRCTKCEMCKNNCSTRAICYENEKLTIRHDKCIGCLICSEICPNGAVEIRNNMFYKQLSEMYEQGKTGGANKKRE